MRHQALNLQEAFASPSRSKKMTMAIIVASLCFLNWPATVWTHGRLQQEKVVVKHAAPPNEPIEIIEPSVRTKAIKLGEGFEAEPEWLRYITFKVKNRSDKTITFLQIDLDFPETKESAGAIMMHQLFFGQRPDFKSTINRPALHLKPDEAMEISLEQVYDQIKTLIELKHPSIDVINKLVIRTNDMMFEDETLFSGGYYYRRNPDPSDRKKWIQIVEAQGAAGNN